jgi:hypothetical protein
MHELAANPLGKIREPKASAVAAMLTQHNNRWAFVRSGQDVGTIQTLDTPPPTVGPDLAGRLNFLREQTRQRYCHPRQDIEKSEQQPPANEGGLPARWEEV